MYEQWDNTVFPPKPLVNKQTFVQQSWHSANFRRFDLDNNMALFFNKRLSDANITSFNLIFDENKKPYFWFANRAVNKVYYLRIDNDLNHWIDQLDTHFDSISISINFPTQNWWAILIGSTSQIYNYIRIKDSMVNNNLCGAEVTFQNTSDESFGIKTYEWKIALDTGHTQWVYLYRQNTAKINLHPKWRLFL